MKHKTIFSFFNWHLQNIQKWGELDAAEKTKSKYYKLLAYKNFDKLYGRKLKKIVSKVFLCFSTIFLHHVRFT